LKYSGEADYTQVRTLSLRATHLHSIQHLEKVSYDDYHHYYYFLSQRRDYGPYRGLPPCPCGGAYAPMTKTIFNVKERS